MDARIVKSNSKTAIQYFDNSKAVMTKMNVHVSEIIKIKQAPQTL